MKTVIVLICTTVLATGVGAASGQSPSRPALKLVQRSPLKVRGLHFRARERIHLTASQSQKQAVASVRSTRHGAFVATFAGFTANNCLKLVVKAVGATGDRARLVVLPPPPTELPCGI